MPRLNQRLGGPHRITGDGLRTLGAIRQPRRVAEIEEIFARQRGDQRAQHREPTDTGIEHADGRIHCGRHSLDSGRMCGNSSTSRIDGASVKNITSRSMPTPRPAVGGMPYSSART